MQTFEEIIKFAIEKEEEAIQSYGKMMNMAKTQSLKKMLQELQDEEKSHKTLLQNVSKEKLDSSEIKDIVDLHISDYLVEESLSVEMSLQDLLIFAAKKEEKAIEFYSDLMVKAEREEIKKLFEFLVQQEKSHKLRLENEYEDHFLEED